MKTNRMDKKIKNMKLFEGTQVLKVENSESFMHNFPKYAYHDHVGEESTSK